jgi:hypothetical protein
MNHQNKQNKSILYVIILLLLLINVGLFYLWQNGKKNQNVMTATNQQLEILVKEKNETIAAAELLLEKYRQDSIDMTKNQFKVSDELARKSSEIARLTYLLKKTQYASQDAIQLLQNKMSELNAELVALRDENQRLKQNNDSLLSVNQNLYGENTKLSLEGKKLKNLAARLTTADIKVETIKKQFLTGKETTTVKAGRVKGFKISYAIAENNIAEPGEREVFIKVTGPEGTTLMNEGQGGLVELADGKSAKYSYKSKIVFENATINSPEIRWEPSKKLTPGNYNIQLFTEGYLMGSASITLR